MEQQRAPTPREIWIDLNEKWPTPVAVYKFPLTVLLVELLDEFRRLLVLFASKKEDDE